MDRRHSLNPARRFVKCRNSLAVKTTIDLGHCGISRGIVAAPVNQLSKSLKICETENVSEFLYVKIIRCHRLKDPANGVA
jgi:hypothetical protein